MTDSYESNQLPADLPVPEDDGAADHLVGQPIPHSGLSSTAGRTIALDDLGPARTSASEAVQARSPAGADRPSRRDGH